MAACGTPTVAATATYPPADWPVYQGTTYCPYLYSPLEIDPAWGCHGTPYLFPVATITPGPGSLAFALYQHRLAYSTGWYDTDVYYNRSIIGRAHYTSVSINLFHSTTRMFDSSHAADEKAYATRYTPKYRDAKGNVVTGSKYGQLNNKVVTKLPNNTGNNLSNAGVSNNNSNNGAPRYNPPARQAAPPPKFNSGGGSRGGRR